MSQYVQSKQNYGDQIIKRFVTDIWMVHFVWIFLFLGKFFVARAEAEAERKRIEAEKAAEVAKENADKKAQEKAEAPA